MCLLKKEIQIKYLSMIKEGTKKYEGRLADKIDEWNLYPGKLIKFYDPADPNSWVLVRVTDLLIFSDFGKAFDELGSDLIPNQTRNSVIKLYNNIYKYPNEKLIANKPSKMIQDKSVVAIKIKVLSMQ